jgi:hypothetical protein
MPWGTGNRRSLQRSPRFRGAETVPLYDDLGRSLPTGSRRTGPEAQRYFDQGLRLTYGFGHPRRIRAFQEGAASSIRSAPCASGGKRGPGAPTSTPAWIRWVAWLHLRPSVERRSWLPGIPPGSPRWSGDLIDAMATRYVAVPTAENRPGLDSLYADAMREVFQSPARRTWTWGRSCGIPHGASPLGPLDPGGAPPARHRGGPQHPGGRAGPGPHPPGELSPLHPRHRGLPRPRPGRGLRRPPGRPRSRGPATFPTCPPTPTYRSGAGGTQSGPTSGRGTPISGPTTAARRGSTPPTTSTCSSMPPPMTARARWPPRRPGIWPALGRLGLLRGCDHGPLRPVGGAAGSHSPRGPHDPAQHPVAAGGQPHGSGAGAPEDAGGRDSDSASV